MSIIEELQSLFKNCVIFNDYHPNPTTQDVLNAHKFFVGGKCDSIITIGGGSAIDTAKALKAYMSLKEKSTENLIDNKLEYSDIKIMSIPTTAGTGSESTKFAVIYNDGIKYSIEHECLFPDLVLLNADFLDTLPDYQKKCTLMDAYSQCIESLWANNSNEYSRKYAKRGLQLIHDNLTDYINGNKFVNEKILLASNFSGKAINISKTTAAHAMSYKLTSLFDISHGHAVILCLPHIINYMLYSINIDDIMYKNLNDTMIYLCKLYSLNNIYEVSTYIIKLIERLELNVNLSFDRKHLNELVNSVNVQRLNNNPVVFNSEEISRIYLDVLNFSNFKK